MAKELDDMYSKKYSRVNRISFIIVLFQLCSLVIYSQQFLEVSDSVGLDYRYPGNDFQMAGGGLMVIDFDNDGWDDLFQCGGIFPSKLWRNVKGRFVDVTSAMGLDTLSHYHIQSAVGADYNNDGYRDFIILNHGEGMARGDKKSPILLRNNLGKSFAVVALDSLLPPGYYTSATWGDFNQDGFSDVYLTNYVAQMGGEFDENGDENGYDPLCHANKLLVNVEGKYFIEQADEYGLADAGCGFAASFTDFDGDGDLDLMLLNDFGEWTKLGNRLFRNNYPNDSFTDVSDTIGFNDMMYGMGIGAADFAHNGRLHYYLTNIGENKFIYFEEDSVINRAHDLAVDLTWVTNKLPGTSWSGLLVDYDFDGDFDLFVSKGNVLTFIPKAVVRDENKFFENRNGRLVDVSDSAGLNDPLSHRGSAIFDFDKDGDLDIISSVLKLPLAAFAGLDQKIKLYANQTLVGNFVVIELVGVNGVNSDCFGCKLEVEVSGVSTIFYVDGGSGHASQSSKFIYCGLGDHKFASQASVRFTDGNSFVVKKLKRRHVYRISSAGKVVKRKY